jgi:hypothetical protein
MFLIMLLYVFELYDGIELCACNYITLCVWLLLYIICTSTLLKWSNVSWLWWLVLNLSRLVMSLRSLLWHVIEMTTLTFHWKGYADVSLKRLLWRVNEKATKMGHMSLKRLLCHVIEKTMMMGKRSLKRLFSCVTEKATLTCH